MHKSSHFYYYFWQWSISFLKSSSISSYCYLLNLPREMFAIVYLITITVMKTYNIFTTDLLH